MADATQTLTLTEFLLARIAEDEDAVKDWPEAGEWGLHSPGAMWTDSHGRPIYAPKARALAECEAKRRIVGLHGRPHPCRESLMHVQPEPGVALSIDLDWPCGTLLALALPYADHPDFREGWRA